MEHDSKDLPLQGHCQLISASMHSCVLALLLLSDVAPMYQFVAKNHKELEESFYILRKENICCRKM